MTTEPDSSAPIAVTVPDPVAMAWYEMNDYGNALRIRDLAQGRLLWVEDHWRAYDGRRWAAEDGQLRAQSLAHEMARHIAEEAEALDDALASATGPKRDMIEDRQEALYKHAVQSGNANKTAAALQQLKSVLRARRDDFDRDPLALNVANGTLRFARREGEWRVELHPHDPADMICHLTGVPWNPKAQAPAWQAHLETVLPRPEVRDFFAACMGYAATGLITEQVILLLQGRGGDGKSTTMDVVRETLGDYAKVAGVESFLAGAVRSGAEASPDMARLAGDCRLACTSEPKIGAKLDEGRIKQITGGQPVTARELHGAPFEYVPRFLLVLECNRKPRISGDDDGIWRRVLVVEFPHQFKGSAVDKGVKDRLLAEREGVLHWLVDGVLAWLGHGLRPPAAVTEAIEEYRRASNPFGEWFAERVDVSDASARVLSADLYASYKTFCDDNGVSDREVMTSTAFGRALGDKQLRKSKDSAGRVIRTGARLRDDGELSLGSAADFASAPPAPPPGFSADDWMPGDD